MVRPRYTVSVSLSEDMYKRLEEYCRKTGKKFSTVLREALNLLFESEGL